LSRKGYDLLLAADEPEIHQVCSDLEAGGRNVGAVQVDLAQREGVERLHDAVTAHPSPVSVGILNAAMGVHGRFDEASLEDQLRLVDLNVRSTLHLTVLLARDMVSRREGRLLLVSSIAGKAPGPGHAAYAASKAFVHSFAEAARHELAGTGVSVTSLLPGPTDTDFFRRAGMDGTVVDDMAKDDPADVARDGVDALLEGDDHVVAHAWRNKAQALLKGLPETAKAATHARMTRQKDSNSSGREGS
jgi:uncharacterized protein